MVLLAFGIYMIVTNIATDLPYLGFAQKYVKHAMDTRHGVIFPFVAVI